MVDSHRKLIFSSYSIFSVVCYITFYYTSGDFIAESLILFGTQLVLFFIFGWNSARGIFKNLINPSYIALIGLIIVNFQNVINVFMGYGNPSDFSVTFVSNDIFFRSSYLSFIGTSIYIFTIYIYNPSFSKTGIKKRKYNNKIWIVMIILAFVGFIATADIGRIISGAAYADDIATTTLDMYFEGLLKSSIVIYISLNVLNKRSDVTKINLLEYIKSFSWAFWVIVSFYLLIRFVSGDRGPVIYTILLILYSYLYLTGKKLTTITILCGGLLAAFVITIIGIARMEAMRASFGERVTDAIDSINGSNSGQNSISPYSQELANSSKCIWIAMGAHDNHVIDYQYGRYTFFNIVHAIPFAGTFLKNFVGLNWNNVSSSSFITKEGLGPNATYGLGTSAVADFYLEFGLLGVILGFISAGIMFKYIDTILYFRPKVSATLLIFSLQVASIAIYFSRYSLSGCINQGLICVVFFWIFNSLISIRIK